MRAMAAAQVDECVRIIDGMIEAANNAGRSHIVFQLPTNLIFDGVKPQEARLIVYSEIVKKYKTPITAGGKGFGETYFEDDPPRVYICWKTGLTDSEREDREAILNGARIPKNYKF